MFPKLLEVIHAHGDDAAILDFNRLDEIYAQMRKVEEENELNDFQKRMINRHITRAKPLDFTPKSVVVAVTPSYFFSKVIFNLNGKKHEASCQPRESDGKSGIDIMSKYIIKNLSENGFNSADASWLPMKRMAAHSGLGSYGRNNIFYTDKFGSICALHAIFTDMPCTNDGYIELTENETCAACLACEKTCPTGAINPKRFMIDTDRCVTYHNEAAAEFDFPAWMNAASHSLLYGCSACQATCPRNKDRRSDTIPPIEFSEAETKLLLAGKKLSELPEELQNKLNTLDLDSYTELLPRNMKPFLAN